MTGKPNPQYRKTMIAKFGSVEAYNAWRRANGLRGGSKRVAKGFSKMDRAKVIAAGKLGGQNGKPFTRKTKINVI